MALHDTGRPLIGERARDRLAHRGVQSREVAPRGRGLECFDEDAVPHEFVPQVRARKPPVLPRFRDRARQPDRAALAQQRQARAAARIDRGLGVAVPQEDREAGLRHATSGKVCREPAPRPPRQGEAHPRLVRVRNSGDVRDDPVAELLRQAP